MKLSSSNNKYLLNSSGLANMLSEVLIFLLKPHSNSTW